MMTEIKGYIHFLHFVPNPPLYLHLLYNQMAKALIYKTLYLHRHLVYLLLFYLLFQNYYL